MMTGLGLEGLLAFEKPGGGADHVTASAVAQVLASGGVPVVVLNACQSGAVGKDLEASVATALLKAGCAAVVGMAYSVYAVAAAEFMAQFYESLFAGATISQAVTAGRKRLFEMNLRPSRKGDLPLADWLVPVHYMRRDVSFPQAVTPRPAGAPPLGAILDQIRASPAGENEAADPLAPVGGLFVGRDDLFWQLETAARLQHVVVLTGPGGTGKTELAKGFARWQRDTGGVDSPSLVHWHSFEPGVASFGLDGALTGLGLQAFGQDFALLDPDGRLAAVKRLLAEHRVLVVWDNFETVREMPDPEAVTPPLDEAGCGQLRGFLHWARDHSGSTILITSRAQETWLGEVRRIAVGGLDRAEAAEYAGHLLAPYPGAQARRDSPAFGELLDWLDGHPLAMRLTLPRLDATSAEELLAGLRGTVPLPAGGQESGGRLSSLAASITYSWAHLAGVTRRLLPAVSLFHGITDEDVLAAFSGVEGVPARFAGVTKDQWSGVLEDAARVGLLTGIGAGMYRIHPALPGYMTAAWQAEDPDAWQQEQAAATNALCAACAAFSDWLTGQTESGDAALAYAILGLQRRTLGAMLSHALGHSMWSEASEILQALEKYWHARGLRMEAGAWADRILAATTEPGRDTPAAGSPAASLWLYTTGQQAGRQQDAGQLDQAERTYRRLLSWLEDQPATDWTRRNIAVACHQLGITTRLRWQLDEADDWYRKSLAIEEELSDRPAMANTYGELGNTAKDRGRLDEAEAWFRKSLAIKDELGDRPGMAIAYHQLGITAQDRGQLDEADDWYRQAIQIREELGLRAMPATDYHHLGMTAYLRGRLDEAENWYRKSLAINEELGDRPGMASTYHQLGVTAQDRGRLDEAEAWYRKSLGIKEELGDRPGMALSYGQLGLLAEARQQPAEALDWTIRCVTLFPEFPHPATGPGPDHLARLTRQLGMEALERGWDQVTGSPLPPQVRDYITSRQGDEEGPRDRRSRWRRKGRR
jgi:tetratricopeptide (TPR) repeat protein